MSVPCPSCGSSFTKVIESRVLWNTSRRRRHRCHDCPHRWSSWEGERPRPGRVPYAVSHGRSKPPLNDDQIRLVLTSDLSSTQLAPLIERSKETVAAIREVAAWLRSEYPKREGYGTAWANMLEQEADRG